MPFIFAKVSLIARYRKRRSQMASPTFDVPKKDANNCSGYLNAVDPAAAEASFRNEAGRCGVRGGAKVSSQQLSQLPKTILAGTAVTDTAGHVNSAAVPTPASSPETRRRIFATEYQAPRAVPRVPVLRSEVSPRFP
jgi:hypothetical protein